MGHHKISFAGDPHALDGAWSPPTSRANFCEEDYSFTAYMAEFINTLTNFIYIYYGILHIRRTNSKDFMSISLLLLGTCSLLFHATLLLPLELSDELSMLALGWSLLQGILTVTLDKFSRRYKLTNVFLALFFVSFSAFYVYSQHIIYHSVVFISILATITLRTTYLLLFTNNFPKDKRSEWTSKAWKTVAILLLAFTVWDIDLGFCAELRALRHAMGLPRAWLFELHGWWHILTGVSAAWFMDIVREMQEEIAKGKKKTKSK
ncbi:ceramidase [Cladorrhinum sp. PSN259]|nr:ceramidase [Cladorrhinum sp. PSN259]